MSAKSTAGCLALGVREPLCTAIKADFETKGWDVDTERQRITEGSFFLALYMACIPAANWTIQHVGTVCTPDGPCLIPVAPGIMAPSGVMLIGLALVLRDLVQRRLGTSYGLLAVLVGTVISALLAPPSLVIASAVAFLLSELADFAVYTPLQARGFVKAVLISSVVGLVAELVRVFVVGLRQPRFPDRPDHRQGLDGSAQPAGYRMAASSRRANRIGLIASNLIASKKPRERLWES